MDSETRLRQYLAKLAGGGLCVAFSGGVDSAALLKAACETGGNVHAVTLRTPFHPLREAGEAEAAAREAGAVFKLIEINELPEEIMLNPPDRCYLCKRAIFTEIRGYAARNGLGAVLDGTNADDLREYRPGLRALTELNVKSPLAELELTKEQVREIAGRFGLKAAKKPSSPCLATRLPYNTRLDPELLQRIDGLETYLRSLGFDVVRARVHGGDVRLEIPKGKLSEAAETSGAIVEKAKSLGFSRVTLDLEGYRSGSFDERPEAAGGDAV